MQHNDGRLLGLGVGLLIASMVLVTGCGESADAGGMSAEAERPTVIRFADTGIEGTEELRRAFGEFVATMEEILGVRVEFFPVNNRTIAATAMQHGQVDLVLAGPTEYLFIRSRQNVQPVIGIERAAYHSAIYVPADSPAQSVADLRGKTIALKEAGSTSGHVMPVWMLMDAGLNPERDIRIQMLGGARIEAFLNGEVDALGDGIRVWNEGRLDRRGEGRFRILAESPPLPRDLLIAREGLPEAFVAEMREKILANSDRIMAAILGPGERVKYEGARFVPIDDADYDDMRRVHLLLGLPYE